MTKHLKVALLAFFVLGWIVAETAGQERPKSPPPQSGQGKKISPELQESAEKMGTWLAGGEFFRDRDYEKAAEVYKQAIRRWPNEAFWPYYLGLAYSKLGRFQEAAEAYKQTIRLEPNHYDAIIALGNIYMRMGRHEEAVTCLKQAIRACKEAIRLKPDDVEAHYTLGMVYLTLKDRTAALEEYKMLQTLDKKRANDLFILIYK